VRTDQGPTGHEVTRSDRPHDDDDGLQSRIRSLREIKNDRLTEEPPYEVSRVEGLRRVAASGCPWRRRPRRGRFVGKHTVKLPR
jgi:hypothetical protein